MDPKEPSASRRAKFLDIPQGTEQRHRHPNSSSSRTEIQRKEAPASDQRRRPPKEPKAESEQRMTAEIRPKITSSSSPPKKAISNSDDEYSDDDSGDDSGDDEVQISWATPEVAASLSILRNFSKYDGTYDFGTFLTEFENFCKFILSLSPNVPESIFRWCLYSCLTEPKNKPYVGVDGRRFIGPLEYLAFEQVGFEDLIKLYNKLSLKYSEGDDFWDIRPTKRIEEDRPVVLEKP